MLKPRKFVGTIDVTLNTDIFPIDFELTNNAGGNPISGSVTTSGAGNTFTITDVPEGTYDLVVTSATACNQTAASLIIDIATPIEYAFEPFVEICAATADLSVTPVNTGATFTWTAPDGSNAGTGTNITGLTESGIYLVTGTAPGACELLNPLNLI